MIVSKIWPTAKVESIWENVASMSEADRDRISELKQRNPSERAQVDIGQWAALDSFGQGVR